MAASEAAMFSQTKLMPALKAGMPPSREPPHWWNGLMTTSAAYKRPFSLSISASVALTAVLSPIASAPVVAGSLGWGGMPEHGPGIVNHPVGVVPAGDITVPPGWPLDDRGAITCQTCHAEIPAGSGGSEPRLRDFEPQAAQPAAFCTKCHNRVDQHNGGSVHWAALGVAHVRNDDADTHGDGRRLDAHTRRCLTCHDGASATESDNITPWTRSRGYPGDRGRNHPVGVRYDGLRRSKGLSPLRPVSLLPREVALPDGKVGCLSCHNLYAGGRYLLSVPIQVSVLCLTCHDMR